ncbi:DUF7344 domain-containing protein [Halorussus halobius]|uniref:DUF7344 domain-containing protein n=1 Tax=Halorussus halobius TaxID=1710537 RepID=UPI0010933465|nr:hypothetical protein [Halorussus halobius]
MTEPTLADENAADVSATFDLLSNARRRGVLYAVGRDGAVTVETLADRIASWQRDGGDAPDADAVRTSLVHAHLPKLDEANAVDYDRGRGTVEPAARASTLDSYLELTRDSEPFPSGASRRPGLAD